MDILYTLSTASLFIGAVCALVIIIDLLTGHSQKMWIMNIVWPATALYSGPLALIGYYTIGRKSVNRKTLSTNTGNSHNYHHKMDMHKKPFWQSVVVGTLHCGSGCTLGDIIAEFGLLLFPFAILGSTLYGSWIVDYIVAFVLGIVFQYYAIKPMKNLSGGKALIAALKADTLSLTCWQVGMYGWMAIGIFIIFHRRFLATDPAFWFMMQIGMVLGFCTAFPINWLLIKKGIKEAM